MPRPGVPSLDQLAVFLTVVETGSFAAAARRLRRATSAISYAIANLEQQLGVQLFDRDQARQPALTRPVAPCCRKLVQSRLASTTCGPRSKDCSMGWRPSSSRCRRDAADGAAGRCNAGIRGDVPDSDFATVRRSAGSCDPTCPFRHCRYRHQRSGCDPSGHRTDQGRWCGTRSRGGAEPPVGGAFGACTGSRAGTLCSSCSPIALH